MGNTNLFTYTKNETQGTQCKVPNDKLSFPMEDYFQVFSQAAVLANSYVMLTCQRRK